MHLQLKAGQMKRYGVFSDPSLPRSVNLLNHVLSLPPTFFSSRLSNSACHNLCSSKTPPKYFASLLGLGLKFCPTPTYTSGHDTIMSATVRFENDFLTKVLFNSSRFDPNDDWSPNQLYLRSQNWSPPTELIDPEVVSRCRNFSNILRPWFTKRRIRRNLSPIQGRLLAHLRNNPDFIIVPSDKNLGPVIMERDEYVHRCFQDHLLKSTYEQLNSAQAFCFVSNTAFLLKRFLKEHRGVITDHDSTYLHRYSASVTDHFSYFYALAKIHKSPWQTRPIVSVSGSTLYGLGKWLDRQLQPFLQKLPTYLPSSYTLKADMDTLRGENLSRMSLFTGDIIAMYPSIDLADAHSCINTFLQQQADCSDALRVAIMNALDLIMHRNCFRFGNTFWLQLDGTAMGVPPAPNFATLYYGIYELQLLSEFRQNLRYLKRYIDDQYGIWIHHPDPTVDRQRWLAFQARQQSFCSLKWVFTPLSKKVHFLDLTITLDTHQVLTTLYEKPLNLHLYIPWHSAHTPSVRSSLITSGILRILRLVSLRSEQLRLLSLFFRRLLTRGYEYSFLRTSFQQAFDRVFRRTFTPAPTYAIHHWLNPIPDKYTQVYLHLPYHPHDPHRRRIQRAFRSTIWQPFNRYTERLFPRILHFRSGDFGFIFKDGDWQRVPATLVHNTHAEPLLEDLKDPDNNNITIDRLIIAYHRAPNLKNLLFPRHVEAKCLTATPASRILHFLQDASTNLPST